MPSAGIFAKQGEGHARAGRVPGRAGSRQLVPGLRQAGATAISEITDGLQFPRTHCRAAISMARTGRRSSPAQVPPWIFLAAPRAIVGSARTQLRRESKSHQEVTQCVAESGVTYFYWIQVRETSSAVVWNGPVCGQIAGHLTFAAPPAPNPVRGSARFAYSIRTDAARSGRSRCRCGFGTFRAG